MKKIAIFSLPAYGHVNPILSVATRLHQRGYQVIYYSTEQFRDVIEKHGLIFKPYNISEDIDLHISNIVDIASTILSVTEKYLALLITALQKDMPDCIIHDQLCFQCKVAAHYLNIPAISVQTSFVISKRIALVYPQVTHVYLSQIIKQFYRYLRNGIRYYSLIKEYQLHTRGFDDIFMNEEPLNIVFTSRLLQPISKSVSNKFIFVGSSIASFTRQEEHSINHLLYTNKPIVYISLGTIFNKDISFFKLCITSFAHSPYEIIMAIGNRYTLNDLPDIPSNFIIQQYLPQLDILQKASVFITHAGMNSITESLFYAVPMICIPQTGEQLLNALRIEQIGAGIVLREKQLSCVKMKNAVRSILGNKKFIQQITPIRESLIGSGGYLRAAEEIIHYVEKESKQ